MIGILRRGRVLFALAGLTVLGIGLMASTAAPSTPAVPSIQYMDKWGMSVHPLTMTGMLQSYPTAVSESQALKAVASSFPGLAPSRPIGAELVLFANPVMPSLTTPQPAWLFTWVQMTAVPGRRGEATPPPVFHRMTEVVSAVTGKVLMEFASP